MHILAQYRKRWQNLGSFLFFVCLVLLSCIELFFSVLFLFLSISQGQSDSYNGT